MRSPQRSTGNVGDFHSALIVVQELVEFGNTFHILYHNVYVCYIYVNITLQNKFVIRQIQKCPMAKYTDRTKCCTK